jgi:hypothetical protein
MSRFWLNSRVRAILRFEGGARIYVSSSNDQALEKELARCQTSSKYVINFQCYNQSNHSIFTQINNS